MEKRNRQMEQVYTAVKLRPNYATLEIPRPCMTRLMYPPAQKAVASFSWDVRTAARRASGDERVRDVCLGHVEYHTPHQQQRVQSVRSHSGRAEGELRRVTVGIARSTRNHVLPTASEARR